MSKKNEQRKRISKVHKLLVEFLCVNPCYTRKKMFTNLKLFCLKFYISYHFIIFFSNTSSFSNSTIAVSLTSLFLRHKIQNFYSNVKTKTSKIRSGEQTLNLHRGDEKIRCDCQSCCCCCYIRLSRERVRVKSFSDGKGRFLGASIPAEGC